MSLEYKIDPRLKIGAVIRHASFLDVALRLVSNPKIQEKAEHVPLAGVGINGLWYNLGFNNTMNIGDTANYVVPWEKIAAGEYEILENPDMDKEPIFQRRLSKCYRSGPWSKILVID